MAVSITKIKQNRFMFRDNTTKVRWMIVDCDASYPTGGYAFDADQYCPFNVDRLVSDQYGGFVAEWDSSTTKLVVTKAGVQVADTTDLTGVRFLLTCYGLGSYGPNPTMAPTALL